MSPHQLSRVSLADCPAMAWKNGGGVTRELLTWSAHPLDRTPSAPTTWDLRVSVADIERDGPFSTFTGIDRGFAVVQGAGVVLSFENPDQVPATQDHEISCGSEALRFAGELHVDCRLQAGPTRDLNFMVRRERGQLHMQRALPGSRSPEGLPWWAIFCWDAGRLDAMQTSLEVRGASLLWAAGELAARAQITWHSGGLAYWMGWKPR